MAKKTKSKKTDKTAMDRAADVSDEVLESVAAAQRKALKAIRKFAKNVDEAMPSLGDGPSRGESVIDAALDLADKFVATQYEFLRSAMQSTDRALDTTEAADLIEQLRRRASAATASTRSNAGSGTFEVYTDRAGKYRFRLRNTEGRILAVGESHATRAACEETIEGIRKGAGSAQVVDA
jgi:uncharacterized protein YegP (UPF0339 family)